MHGQQQCCDAVASDAREGSNRQVAGLQPVCEHHRLAEGETGGARLWLSHHLWFHDSPAPLTGRGQQPVLVGASATALQPVPEPYRCIFWVLPLPWAPLVQQYTCWCDRFTNVESTVCYCCDGERHCTKMVQTSAPHTNLCHRSTWCQQSCPCGSAFCNSRTPTRRCICSSHTTLPAMPSLPLIHSKKQITEIAR